jgi:hypothetical protein
MTAVAVEIFMHPPVPEPGTAQVSDPYAIEVVADTDRLMTMCNCSQSSDNPY